MNCVFDRADQHHRPFRQAGDFVQQPLVRDHFQAMHKGGAA